MESQSSERKRTIEEIQDAQIGLLEWEIELHGRDPLTGLKTKEAFVDDLKRAVESMHRKDEPRKGVEHMSELSVLFIDLDNFKNANDMHGHAEGDNALIEAAKCITSSIRESQDVAARRSGDEFFVFMPRTERVGTKVVAEKIITKIRTNELLNKYGVTASAGAFCTNRENSADLNAEDIIKKADEAMYRAKQEGKNTLVIDGA